ncbi:MAG: hypothetical protein FJ123_00340 [Deltaproteobacteria bacterium]|nr:hypothetical protein [Deltaproteobacteria bacterium]
MEIKNLVRRFCDYSTYIRGYSQDTIRRYHQTMGYFSRTSNITEIEEITMEKVRNFFFQGRAMMGWSSNSFITYHKTLAVFFRWCVQEGVMNQNFTDEIELPKLEKKLPSKLTKQQTLKILEIVYNYPYEYPFLRFRNYAIFATFILAGLRRKELLNLKVTDVDLENMSIFVRQGKGGKDRVVPICYKLAESLEKYLAERKRLKRTCAEFFVSLNHNMGFTENGLKHLVEDIKRASGIKFSVHKLRHTFATLMLEGGCDIFSLSKMMGHSDIKTTTIYLAASVEHLRSQISKHPLNSLKADSQKLIFRGQPAWPSLANSADRPWSSEYPYGP